MKKFNAHPHIPEWIEAMDGELLTTPQLDVLNFIHWCKRFGCRTSNDRIGSYIHHTHATVQRAIAKLYQMDLVAIENYAKRTRTIKPVQWPDKKTWEEYKKMADCPKVDPAHCAPHIPSLDKTIPLTGYSLEKGKMNRPTDDDILPSNAGGLCGSVGGVGKVDIPFTPKPEIPVPTYQEAAVQMRDKLIKIGWTQKQAERKTRKRYPEAKFKD